jgi:Domain of unknown function (DUF4159)
MVRFILFALILLALPDGLQAQDNWLQKAASRDVAKFDGGKAASTEDVKTDRRGKVVLRRLRPSAKSDWNTDPTALPYFFYQLRERTQGKFPIYLDNEGLALSSKEIFDYPIIYFTSHFPFQFSDDEVDNLKKYLARGGTLLLDDCTGSGPFMDSVPPNVQRIIPQAEMKLMLKENKAFVGLFELVYKLDGLPELKEQFMQPFQCAYFRGRPAILVCPNDYGCYWEVSSPPTALNPLGNAAHSDSTPTAQKGREEVYQISINWLFYALTH